MVWRQLPRQQIILGETRCWSPTLWWSWGVAQYTKSFAEFYLKIYIHFLINDFPGVLLTKVPVNNLLTWVLTNVQMNRQTDRLNDWSTDPSTTWGPQRDYTQIKREKDRNVTWLTVVPIEPCNTIWSILGFGGSWLIALRSSFVLSSISSMATSMGLNTIYKTENKINVRRKTRVWRLICYSQLRYLKKHHVNYMQQWIATNLCR